MYFNAEKCGAVFERVRMGGMFLAWLESFLAVSLYLSLDTSD